MILLKARLRFLPSDYLCFSWSILKYTYKFKVIDTKEIQVIIVDKAFDQVSNPSINLSSNPNIIGFCKQADF